MQFEYNKWGNEPPNYLWCKSDRTDVEVKFLKAALRFSKKQSVLDLFCSWGRHVIAFANQGYNVIGLDISKSMIDRARQEVLRAKCNSTFILADIHSMPFVEEFDTIYSIQSSLFEAWRKPDEILKLLSCVRRALKPGGKYLFGWSDNWNRSDVAKPRWRQKLKEAMITEFDGKEFPFHFYGLKEQTELINKAGFRVQNVYNNYDSFDQYTETKPGLIMFVMKMANDR